MKKALTLLLVLLLSFSLLTGCKAKGDSALLGSWQYSLDLAEPVQGFLDSMNLGQVGQQMDMSNSTLTLTLTFAQDGTYTCLLDGSALSTLVTQFNELSAKVGDGTQITLEKLLEMMGVDAGQLLPLLNKLLEGKELPKEIRISGSYKTEDGKLFLSLTKVPLFTDSHFTYTAEDSTLTLTGFSGTSEEISQSLSELFPLALQKVL